MNQQFKLYPSIHLTVMLCLVHGAALAVLPLLALSGWCIWLLALMVVSSLAYHLWRDAWLRAPGSCSELRVEEGGDAVLVLRNGEQLRGAIARGSLVTPYLTVLRIVMPHRRVMRGVAILSDSMDRNAFRQLRVWLKWGRQEAA